MDTLVNFLRAIGQNNEVLVFLAATAGTAVTQLIKSGAKWKEQAALTLAIIVAGVLGILSAWANNGYITPEDFVNNFTTIFTLSTLFYKLIVDPQVRLKKLEEERNLLLLANARQNEN